MQKEFIEQIEKSLIAKRDEILQNLKSKSEHEIDLDGDETDIIQGNFIASIESQVSQMEQIKITQINNTILKIKNGEFGICEECGEEIGEKRLLVNPSFLTCISCAEKLEKSRLSKK